jgi:RHS repeat-associated protein
VPVAYQDWDGYRNLCVQVEWADGMFPYNPAPRAADHWQGTLPTEKRDASGLLYRRNRYYDPGTGRFTQEDPIGLAGGVNVYGFAAGDPVSYADPYGLAACPMAPRDSPRYSGSFLDCTPEEMRRAQGVEEPLFGDPLNLIPAGAVARGVTRARGIWRGLRGMGAAGFARMFGGRATMEVGELTTTHGPRLSRRAFGRLTEDIALNGIKDPIKYVVYEGRNYVVDGHPRLRVARRLGMEHVPVEQVTLPFRGYKVVDDLVNYEP